MLEHLAPDDRRNRGDRRLAARSPISFSLPLDSPKQSMPTATTTSNAVTLARDTNQALGIGEYAVDFMGGCIGAARSRRPRSHGAVLHRQRSLRTLRPRAGHECADRPAERGPLLRRTRTGVPVFGARTLVAPGEGVVANCSAVREWDSNGTNFGYNPALGHTAGEFGHNDFYPVRDRRGAARRTRTAPTRCAAWSAWTRSADASPRCSASRPTRSTTWSTARSRRPRSTAPCSARRPSRSSRRSACSSPTTSRGGRSAPDKQLSDSKGASAAISTEAAVLSMQRSLSGFVGPKDIFRNPEAIWRQFEPTNGDSPFDLVLGLQRRRLRRHGHALQARSVRAPVGRRVAGADRPAPGSIRDLLELPSRSSRSRSSPTSRRSASSATRPSATRRRGSPPTTRWSTSSRRCCARRWSRRRPSSRTALADSGDGYWKPLMLGPYDYARDAIFHPRDAGADGARSRSSTAARSTTRATRTASRRRS